MTIIYGTDDDIDVTITICGQHRPQLTPRAYTMGQPRTDRRPPQTATEANATYLATQAETLARRIHELYRRAITQHPSEQPIPAWDDATDEHRRALTDTALSLLKGENADGTTASPNTDKAAAEKATATRPAP